MASLCSAYTPLVRTCMRVLQMWRPSSPLWLVWPSFIRESEAYHIGHDKNLWSNLKNHVKTNAQLNWIQVWEHDAGFSSSKASRSSQTRLQHEAAKNRSFPFSLRQSQTKSCTVPEKVNPLFDLQQTFDLVPPQKTESHRVSAPQV